MATLPDFDALWDYNRPAKTEARFRKLIPLAQGSGNRSYYAQVLTQLARALGLQRRFDEAHAVLNEADALITDDLLVARVRSLLERGRAFNSAGQPAIASPFFKKAFELAASADEDGYAVDALHMLAIASPPDQQMEWNLRALALAESSTQPQANKWLGSLYNNIGWTLHSAGKYDKALEMFQKALAWRIEQDGRIGAVRVARWCVARALRSLNRTEEALQIQTSLLAEFEQAGETDGYVYEEIAECLLALDRREEARPHFASAYTILSQDEGLVANEPSRLERLRQLGTA